MEPVVTPAAHFGAARRVLVAAAAIHVALWAYQFRGPLAALARPQAVTTPDKRGPFANGADCVGYYAWLRAPLIYGDFHFDEEFAPTNARLPKGIAPPSPTAAGHLPNPWSVGPAIVWAPAVVAVHLILVGLGDHSPYPADGFSPPYQLAVGATTLALALVTLVLMYRIARRFAGPRAAAAAAALVTLGTPVVAYGTVEVSMAHGPATAALTLFAFVWLRTFGSPRPRRWLLLGGLLGLTALMRWQLATFAVLPAAEAVWLWCQTDDWPARGWVAARLAAAGLVTAIVFIPQLAAKQVVYGGPLGGFHRTAHNWLAPPLWTVLGSTDRSFGYWTPLALAGVAGLVWAAVRTRRPALVILALAVVSQIYALSAVLGGETALGWSFGFRLLTETCALTAPGAALMIETASPATARRIAGVGGVLVGWNLCLLGVYRNCLVEGGADPATLLMLVGRFTMIRPLEAIASLAGAAWLTFTLVTAFRAENGPVVAVITAPVPRQRAA